MKNERLDRRIVIERATETRDQFNEVIFTWAAIDSAYASKEDIRDTERLAAREIGADVTTRFQVRWTELRATVDAKDRIVYDGLVHSIVATKEIGRRDGIEFTAVARAD